MTTNSNFLSRGRCAAQIAMVVLTSLISTIAQAQLPHTFDLEWGTYGSADGKFDLVFGVAVDALGNIYTADSGNERIQKFDASGNFLLKWGSSGFGDGQFSFPEGIAAGSGVVYVADTFNDRIQKFDASGNFLLKWGSTGTGDGQLDFPKGIALDASGNVYVAGSSNNRIQKFDADGTFLSKWGSTGTGDGQFDTPEDVAVDGSGNIYVADTANDRIQKFDSSGTFLLKWGSFGTGDGQFSNPESVAVDGAGNVYIADSGNDRIQKFDASGTFLTKWGTGGSGMGNFTLPEGIAIDASDNVYVADTGNDILQKFNPPVPPVASFTTNVTSGLTPLAVSFTDTSTAGAAAITTWAWDFGDPASGGLNTSALQNPSHTYNDPGMYTVTLTVTTAAGSDPVTMTDLITATIPPVGPTAAFTPSATSGNTPFAVSFTDTSAPGTATITTWAWDFGDPASGGLNTSALQNPSHTYNDPGMYTVTLTVTTAVGSDPVTMTDLVTATAPLVPPTAAFTPSTTSGDTPLAISFTDTSAPGTASITTWAWNFGDPASGGLNTSALENPSHTYNDEGTYTVMLTVTTSVGSDAVTMTNLITTTSPPLPPAAAFTQSPTSGELPLEVFFTDTSDPGSSPITSWAWDFGDPASGVLNTSTMQNPSHIYNDLEMHIVTLIVTTAVGSSPATTTELFAPPEPPALPVAGLLSLSLIAGILAMAGMLHTRRLGERN